MNSLEQIKENFNSFQVNSREVHIDKLPALSAKAQSTAEAYFLSPPKLSWELKDYSSQIQKIEDFIKGDKAFYLIALTGGVVMTAIPILLGITIGSGALVATSPLLLGSVFIGLALFHLTEWGHKVRITEGQKELQYLKEFAQQYLDRFFRFYKLHGEHLQAILGEEDPSVREEVDNMLGIYQQMAGSKMYPNLSVNKIHSKQE